MAFPCMRCGAPGSALSPTGKCLECIAALIPAPDTRNTLYDPDPDTRPISPTVRQIREDLSVRGLDSRRLRLAKTRDENPPARKKGQSR